MEEKRNFSWIRFLAGVIFVMTLAVSCFGAMGVQYSLQNNLFMNQEQEGTLAQDEAAERLIAMRLMTIFFQQDIAAVVDYCDGSGVFFAIYKVSNGDRLGGTLSSLNELTATSYRFQNGEIVWLNVPDISKYRIKVMYQKDAVLPAQDAAYIRATSLVVAHPFHFAIGTGIGCLVSICLFLYLVLGGQQKAEAAGLYKIPAELVLLALGWLGAYLVDRFGKNLFMDGYHPFFHWYSTWVLLVLCTMIVIHLVQRVRRVGWQRYTLCYMLYSLLQYLWRFLVQVYENRSSMAKALTFLGIVTVAELLVLLFLVPPVFPGGYYKAYYAHNYNDTYTWVEGFAVDYKSLIVWIVWLGIKLIESYGMLRFVLAHKQLQQGVKEAAKGNLQYKVDIDKLPFSCKEFGEDINALSQGVSYEVEQRLKSERFKTELITNVSHDIKTPLTSIINFADLIAKEESENANITEYASHLYVQSTRLKKLIEDLMEASKASTGNMEVHLETCDAKVLLGQCLGEYEERMQERCLDLIIKQAEEPLCIQADTRMLWRIFDNLMNNIIKYAQAGTRVYLTTEKKEDHAVITFKNISTYPLDISPEELSERFVRGDLSRHTEGNGLGLSIVKSLMDLQGGKLELSVDGDLFKAILQFPIAK